MFAGAPAPERFVRIYNRILFLRKKVNGCSLFFAEFSNFAAFLNLLYNCNKKKLHKFFSFCPRSGIMGKQIFPHPGFPIKKTFFKTVTRSVRGNTARLLSVAFIILLGIAFVSGLGPFRRPSSALFRRNCARRTYRMRSPYPKAGFRKRVQRREVHGRAHRGRGLNAMEHSCSERLAAR